jgi:pimeloyl-ACP methyl ester carboxylesterase
MKRRHFLGASLTLPIFSQIHAAKAVDKKPTIVLVHGAWHGGWCWKKVTSQLRADGFEVFAPTLTGLGERVHLLNYDINLDTHIQDITAVLEYEDLKNVILVGHSYGGMVITGVAEKAKDRISQLVYLDAFLPENGKALADYAQLPPFQKDAI